MEINWRGQDGTRPWRKIKIRIQNLDVYSTSSRILLTIG